MDKKQIFAKLQESFPTMRRYSYSNFIYYFWRFAFVLHLFLLYKWAVKKPLYLFLVCSICFLFVYWLPFARKPFFVYIFALHFR
jgi:hypothetical protein